MSFRVRQNGKDLFVGTLKAEEALDPKTMQLHGSKEGDINASAVETK